MPYKSALITSTIENAHERGNWIIDSSPNTLSDGSNGFTLLCCIVMGNIRYKKKPVSSRKPWTAAQWSNQAPRYDHKMPETPGEWRCNSCCTRNYPQRSHCFRCKGPRTNGTVLVPIKPFDEADIVNKNIKTGDWQCCNCGAHVWKKRLQCGRCDQPRGNAPNIIEPLGSETCLR